MSTSVRRWPPTSAVLVTAALILAGCSTPPDSIPKQGITFAVDGHGTADITWSGTPDGSAAHATLPWHTSVQEPINAHPVTLTVVLNQQGGQATCTITINGRRVSSSLAQGPSGRATCHTPTTAGNALQSGA